MFFTRANAEQSTILVSRLSAGTWSKPEIASFSGLWRDLEPTMAVDGSYLIFASNRPATDGGRALDAFYNAAPQLGKGGNLWRVDRTASGWSTPHPLPDVVNGNTSIFSPALAGDGSLYFMRPTGAKTRFHIFRAQLTGGAYQTPVPVAVSASDSVRDFDPVVAPDESFMVFRPHGCLRTAHRSSSSFGRAARGARPYIWAQSRARQRRGTSRRG